jgi:hypothetical protein
MGSLTLAVVAAREERQRGAQESYRKLVWANLVNRDRREAVFASVVERDRAALAARQSSSRDEKYARIRSERAEEIEARRRQQSDDRRNLKEKQMAERDRTTIEWRQLSADERRRQDEEQLRRREDDDRRRREEEQLRRREEQDRQRDNDLRRQEAIDRNQERFPQAAALRGAEQELEQREERSQELNQRRENETLEMHLRPDQPRDLKPLPEIYSDRDAEIDGPSRDLSERRRLEAVEDLENGAYGREDTRVEDLMREYGLEEPSDLQALDADKFREFEARREDIAREDIESRVLAADSRFHFGKRSEEEKTQERLRSIRESREEQGQSDERSAADRLAEMRQEGRDREAEERAKRSRDRDNGLGL